MLRMLARDPISAGLPCPSCLTSDVVQEEGPALARAKLKSALLVEAECLSNSKRGAGLGREPLLLPFFNRNISVRFSPKITSSCRFVRVVAPCCNLLNEPVNPPFTWPWLLRETILRFQPYLDVRTARAQANRVMVAALSLNI